MYATNTDAKILTSNKERPLYEEKLQELYAEIDRLYLHVDLLEKKMERILPNELAVETPPDHKEKEHPVPLIRDLISIRDRISIITNKLMFLTEHSVI